MNAKIVLGVVVLVAGLVGVAILLPLSTMDGFNGGFKIWPNWEGRPTHAGNPPITMAQAEHISRRFLSSLNDPNLAVKEIMEFENNFYVIYYEEDTGMGAFEMLIWKIGPNAGRMTPEPGPNMMWNAKYGMMRMHGMGPSMMESLYEGAPTADMPISESEARTIGQQYLNEHFPGATITESTKFYGYYTFDFGKDGEIIGMFSVNGYSGQVWYHGWHGAFIGMEEYGVEHES